MRTARGRLRLRRAWVPVSIALLCAALAPSASARGHAHKIRVKRILMPAPPAPGTPEAFHVKGTRLPRPLNLNQVGAIEVGPSTATNVLVLEPGTSAAAASFVPFAKWLVEHVEGWQVWAVERRENLLEDQTMLNKGKQGKASAEEVFNYYLGWIVDPAVKRHFNAIPEESVGFAREWGMNVAVEDLHVVIEAAKALGGKVVLGGHSLGGSVVTAYATWDFGGQPGADGLSGLVYDDGGSSPIPISKEEAENELTALSKKSPWLAFGGIPSPYLGLFSALGATAAVEFPEEASLAESFPLLPAELLPKGPEGEVLPVTNEAEFGYGVNYLTSPPSLIAAQVHAGKGIAEKPKEDGLYGWNGEGALTPLKRYAEMLSGTGIHDANGTEWYFPERLTIDTGAVAEGNANPAQEVLDEHAIYGHDLPKSLKILAIDTELDKYLGAGNTLEAAEILAEQSGIPKENLTLINEEETYSHNDPAGAYPNNEFFNELVPFLQGL